MRESENGLQMLRLELTNLNLGSNSTSLSTISSHLYQNDNVQWVPIRSCKEGFLHLYSESTCIHMNKEENICLCINIFVHEV